MFLVSGVLAIELRKLETIVIVHDEKPPFETNCSVFQL